MKQLQRLPARQPSSHHLSSSTSRALTPDQPETEWEAIQAETSSSRDIVQANQPRLSFVNRPPVRSPMQRREEILMLHRTIGNQAVGRLLRAGQRREHSQATDLAPGPQEPFEVQASPPQVNRTGLPDPLKARVEQLAGLSLDDVRVHYHSAKPAQVQALAYTQGTQIHVAPGQEEHLAHEAWHVVQQKQGRVQPTAQVEGMAINDDPALEQEADVMPTRLAGATTRQFLVQQPLSFPQNVSIQRVSGLKEGEKVKFFKDGDIKKGTIVRVTSYGYRIQLEGSTVEYPLRETSVYRKEEGNEKILLEQNQEIKRPTARKQKEEEAEQSAKGVSGSGKQETTSLSGAIRLTGGSQMIIRDVTVLRGLLARADDWGDLEKLRENVYQENYKAVQTEGSSEKVSEILAYLKKNFSNMERFLQFYISQFPKVSVSSPDEEKIANAIYSNIIDYLNKIQEIGRGEISEIHDFVTAKKSEEEIKQRTEEIKEQEIEIEKQKAWKKDFDTYYEKYKDVIAADRGATTYPDENTLAKEVCEEFKEGTLLLKTNVAGTKDSLEKIVGTQIHDPRWGQLLSSATLLVPNVPRSPFALDQLAVLYSGLKATIFLAADFDLESSGWSSAKWFDVIHGRRLAIARLAQSKGLPASEELYEPQYKEIEREQGKTALQKLAQTTDERWKDLQVRTESDIEEQKRLSKVEQEKKKYNEILSDLKPPSVLGLCKIATTAMLKSEEPALIKSLRDARKTIAKNLPLFLYDCDKGTIHRVSL